MENRGFRSTRVWGRSMTSISYQPWDSVYDSLLQTTSSSPSGEDTSRYKTQARLLDADTCTVSSGVKSSDAATASTVIGLSVGLEHRDVSLVSSWSRVENAQRRLAALLQVTPHRTGSSAHHHELVATINAATRDRSVYGPCLIHCLTIPREQCVHLLRRPHELVGHEREPVPGLVMEQIRCWYVFRVNGHGQLPLESKLARWQLCYELPSLLQLEPWLFAEAAVDHDRRAAQDPFTLRRQQRARALRLHCYQVVNLQVMHARLEALDLCFHALSRWVVHLAIWLPLGHARMLAVGARTSSEPRGDVSSISYGFHDSPLSDCTVRINQTDFTTIIDRTRAALRHLYYVRFKHTLRTGNKMADKLANIAMDQAATPTTSTPLHAFVATTEIRDKQLHGTTPWAGIQRIWILRPGYVHRRPVGEGQPATKDSVSWVWTLDQSKH